MRWANGDYYEGIFISNAFSKYGKYYCAREDSYYEGEYLKGLKHGRGSITSGGEKLEGYWEMGKFVFNKKITNPHSNKELY